MKTVFKLLFLAAIGYVVYTTLFGTPDLSAVKKLEIPKGAGVADIAGLLKDAHLIRSTIGFETFVWLTHASAKLQAGEYTFEPKMHLADIVRVLTRGLGAINERELTVIEGWGKSDIAKYFKEQGVAEEREVLNLISNKAQGASNTFSVQALAFLKDKPVSTGLEGYLFPDTYRVFKNATLEDTIKKMLENFDSKVTPEMRADIAAQGNTMFDIVRMASIVEKEVPNEEDRPIIAGILWKRLDIGMPLQVDSTLNYVTGGKNTALTAQELKMDSPYNTYKYKGLPPTPISNPGLSALRAAIYPQRTAYLYFLSGKDGKTHFAKTLEEHNRNKVRYLK